MIQGEILVDLKEYDLEIKSYHNELFILEYKF